MRIGIVEDNAAIAEIFEKGLKLSGNEVVIYTNAQDAMAAILGARFNNEAIPHDVLITDLDLGQGIDGAEMIRRLRQFLSEDELPLLIMSGQDLAEQNLLSKNLLDIRVLPKPITPSGLLKEARKITGKGH